MADSPNPLVWAFKRDVPLGSGDKTPEVGGVVQYPFFKNGGVESQNFFIAKSGNISSHIIPIVNGNWEASASQPAYEHIYPAIKSTTSGFTTLDVDHPSNGRVYIAAANDSWLFFGQYTYMFDCSPFVESFDYTEQADSKVTQFSASIQNIGADIFAEDTGLFNPGAKVQFNVKAGDSEPFQMAVMWLDEIGYSVTDSEVSLSGRNAIGYFLKDQTLDKYNVMGQTTKIQGEFSETEMSTPVSTDKFRCLLGSIAQKGWANVFPYGVQDMTATRDWQFDPSTTILEAIEEMCSAWSDKSNYWADGIYRMHLLDIFETNRGVVGIGFDEYRQRYVSFDKYQFDLGSEIFTRNSRKNVDSAYTSLMVTGKKDDATIESEKAEREARGETDDDTASEYWPALFIDLEGLAEDIKNKKNGPEILHKYWTLGPRRTKHISAPDGLTEAKFKEWADDEALKLINLGLTEEFTGPLRPQIQAGDVAEIIEDGWGLNAGIISEVRHSFSRTDGFKTSFSIDSGGYEERPEREDGPTGRAISYTYTSKSNGYNRRQNTVDVLRSMVVDSTGRTVTASGSSSLSSSSSGSGVVYVNGVPYGSNYVLPIATSTKLGGVKAVNKNANIHTSQVAIDSNGLLWSENNGGNFPEPTPADEGKILKVNSSGEWALGVDNDTQYSKATNTVLGLVKAPDATAAQTETVGIDSDGYLKTHPEYVLPMATANALGGVKASAKTSAQIESVGIDSNGFLWAEELMATNNQLGGVKADSKTNDHRQPIGIDSNGNLWAKEIIADASNLGGVKANQSTTDFAQEVRIDSNGFLLGEKASSSKWGAVKPNAKTSNYVQNVASDTDGKLYGEKASSNSWGSVKANTKTDQDTINVNIDSDGFLWSKSKNEVVQIDYDTIGLTSVLTQAPAFQGYTLEGIDISGTVNFQTTPNEIYQKFVHSSTISVKVSATTVPNNINYMPRFDIEVFPLDSSNLYLNRRGDGWDDFQQSLGWYPEFYLYSPVVYIEDYAYNKSCQIRVTLKYNRITSEIYIWDDHVEASSTKWGLVKANAKTADHINTVGIDYNGFLWSEESGFAYTIPFGVVDSTSTSTAFKATVPGVTELKSGVLIYLMNGVVTSASGWTLNINNLGAKPVYSSMAAATRSTTIFNKNYTMMFIYNESRVSGGCWDVFYGYNTNTTYVAATAAKLGLVKADTKTSAQTQSVGIDSNGFLWAEGGGSSLIVFDANAIDTGVIRQDHGSFESYEVDLTAGQSITVANLESALTGYNNKESEICLKISFPNNTTWPLAALSGYGNINLELKGIETFGNQVPSYSMAVFSSVIGYYSEDGPFTLEADVLWSSQAIMSLKLYVTRFKPVSGGGGGSFPAVTAADNHCVMAVVNGVWTKIDIKDLLAGYVFTYNSTTGELTITTE